jgi:hypothetical protein
MIVSFSICFNYDSTIETSHQFMMVLNILRITSINKIHDEKEAVGLNQNDSNVLFLKGEEYQKKTQPSLLTNLITTTLKKNCLWTREFRLGCLLKMEV